MKLPEQRIVSRLEPRFTKLPVPVSVPEPPSVKLFVLESTVKRLGFSDPLVLTEVGSPALSSNKTWSPGLNTVCWLLPRLSQLAELPTSQVPLLPLAAHSSCAGVNKVRTEPALVVVPLLLPTITP